MITLIHSYVKSDKATFEVEVSLLLYRLLIMEKTGNQKGAGLHWDIVLLCLINAISATFGGPWICAATVRGMNCCSYRIRRKYGIFPHDC